MSNARNVVAFEKLMGYCTGYAGKYNPGQQNLQVNALATLLNNAQQKIHDVRMASIALVQAKTHRMELHQAIRPMTARIMSALTAMQLSEATLADARSFVRKIQSNRKVTDTETVPPGGDAIAPKRMARGGDYVSRLDYFTSLVRFVEQVPGYVHNEPALSVKGLRQMLTSLQTAQAQVANCEVNLEKARQARNATLYSGAKSLVATAIAVKRYVQSVFGFTSAEFRAVRAIRFINYA